MKVITETDRVYYYLTKDKDEMIAIKYYANETMFKGASLCDMCAEHDDIYYLCPELGSNGLCTKCFRSYKMRASWYESDKSFMFNQLIIYVLNYGLTFSEEDLDLINEYFASHSHRDKVDIRHFIKKYNGGDN